MRKESFAIGDYLHVYNRGNRKQEIVRDANDRWRFLQILYYFNTRKTPENPFRDLRDSLKSDFNSQLVWPKTWDSQEPIVSIAAFVLMENHFHLLVKEVVKGGLTLFMRRLGTGMTNRFNIKYRETGRLFQGAYKAKRVDADFYLEQLSVYIQVKNPFELYPNGGFKKALEEFDAAYEWAAKYPYCSLGDYARNRMSPIVTKDKDSFGELASSHAAYKKLAREYLINPDFDEKLNTLLFDS
mgnify:CR=1 FL=1